MKDFLTEQLTKHVQEAVRASGGADAAFGKPIALNGREIIPVAAVRIVLGANSAGAGGGDIGAQSAMDARGAAGAIAGGQAGGLNLAGLAGGGGGQADAGITIEVQPAGFIAELDGKPVFQPITGVRS